MRPVRLGERGGGLAMARGALDEFPLFRRCANIARCDITEDAELGYKHRDPVSCRTAAFLKEPISRNLK